MQLQECYDVVCRSIVAIAVKPLPNEPSQDLPTIIGTGFVIADGWVATNDHVLQQVTVLQKMPGRSPTEWPVSAVLFHLIPEKGMCQVSINIRGAFEITELITSGCYYGPHKPDIGFFQVDMRGLPPLRIAESLEAICPGTPVATAGFPMGTTMLRAPGYVHQLTPTLQTGIVSAVLPFQCAAPHALMLNMMSQGGASGSPIFLHDSPNVVGVLYGGLEETYSARVQGIRMPYAVPTNFTYCVAGHFLRTVLAEIHNSPECQMPADAPHFNEVLEEAERRYKNSSSPSSASGSS